MAKVSGVGTTFTIDNPAGSPITFSANVGTCNLNTSKAQQDVTGMDKNGTERINLRGDVAVDFSGFIDDAGQVIGVFGDTSGERDLVVAYPGSITATLKVLISSFAIQRGADGSLGWTAQAAQSDGADVDAVYS